MKNFMKIVFTTLFISICFFVIAYGENLYYPNLIAEFEFDMKEKTDSDGAYEYIKDYTLDSDGKNILMVLEGYLKSENDLEIDTENYYYYYYVYNLENKSKERHLILSSSIYASYICKLSPDGKYIFMIGLPVNRIGDERRNVFLLYSTEEKKIVENFIFTDYKGFTIADAEILGAFHESLYNPKFIVNGDTLYFTIRDQKDRYDRYGESYFPTDISEDYIYTYDLKEKKIKSILNFTNLIKETNKDKHVKINDLELTPDKKLLILCNDNYLRNFNPETNAILYDLEVKCNDPNHIQQSMIVKFHGKKAFINYYAGAIQVIDLENGTTLGNISKKKSASLYWVTFDVEFPNDGNEVMVTYADGSFMIYDMNTFKLIKEVNYQNEKLGWADIIRNNLVVTNKGLFFDPNKKIFIGRAGDEKFGLGGYSSDHLYEGSLVFQKTSNTSLSVWDLSSVINSIPINIKINGTIIDTEVSPIIVNGKTFVPVRIISEYLGCNVEWLPDTQEIVISRDDRYIKLSINNTTAYINDETITLENEPFIKEGRTFVPVRFITESLNMKVEWNNLTKSVLIKNVN